MSAPSSPILGVRSSDSYAAPPNAQRKGSDSEVAGVLKRENTSTLGRDDVTGRGTLSPRLRRFKLSWPIGLGRVPLLAGTAAKVDSPRNKSHGVLSRDGSLSSKVVTEIRVLASETPGEELVACLSDAELVKLAACNNLSARETLGAIQKVQSGLQTLQNMERLVCMDAVQNRLLSGQHYVRGRDKRGRPIMWTQIPRGVRHMTPDSFPVVCLSYFFVHMWALANRSDEDAGVTFVFDDHGRELLDFNLDLNRSCQDLASNLSSLLSPVTGPVYVFGLKKQEKFVSEWIRSLVGQRSWPVKYVKNRELVFDIAADPDDVPDTFVAGRGAPFRPCRELVGNFESLLERSAFSAMTIRDICFPSRESGPLAGPLRKAYRSEKLNQVGSDEEFGSELSPRKWHKPSSRRILPTIAED